MESNKINIAVFGPHDRFNYGDLLFPIMIKYALQKISKLDVNYQMFSLVRADFRKRGAFSSKNYRALSNAVNEGCIDAIIVAGGECLHPKWDNLLNFISPKYHLLRKSKNKFARYIMRKKLVLKALGAKSEHPYCVNKDDFQKKIKLLFNSVGAFHPFNEQQKEYLKKADYVSVRDKMTFRNTSFLDSDSWLVPDSACILSDVFPVNELCESKFIRKGILNIEKPFIFFQISNYYHQNKKLEIIDQLLFLEKTYNLKVVLCPIGTAPGHEDHTYLEKISNDVKHFMYIKNPNIQEIAYLIAKSRIYIGSSLHGIITAMSYGVSYIGLNPVQTKIKSYLETWSISELQYLVNLNEFGAAAQTVLDENLKNKLDDNSEILKIKYYQSARRMIKVLQ